MPPPLQADLWHFDLESGVQDVTWATSAPILVLMGLSLFDFGQMYASDRQTSDRHTSNAQISTTSSEYDSFSKSNILGRRKIL